MAYDTYLNRKTGDWAFNAVGDFMGVTGEEFDRQRIWVRAKIPRGTFTYDKAKTLGSTLYQVTRNPSPDQLAAAQAAMYTALEGILGVTVESVDAVLDGKQIALQVSFSNPAGEVDAFSFQLASGVAQQIQFDTE